MRDHPDTAHLLASARRALLEQVVPALEGEAHSTALMLARVFSVLAARLAVDTRALHFFDVDTGLGIYDGAETRDSVHDVTVAVVDSPSKEDEDDG